MLCRKTRHSTHRIRVGWVVFFLWSLYLSSHLFCLLNKWNSFHIIDMNIQHNSSKLFIWQDSRAEYLRLSNHLVTYTWDHTVLISHTKFCKFQVSYLVQWTLTHLRNTEFNKDSQTEHTISTQIIMQDTQSSYQMLWQVVKHLIKQWLLRDHSFLRVLNFCSPLNGMCLRTKVTDMNSYEDWDHIRLNIL